MGEWEWEISVCRSCGARVIWVTTTRGKRVPVDADPAPGGNVQLSVGAVVAVPGVRVPRAHVLSDGVAQGRDDLRRAHFATCPDRDRWRQS